MESDSFVADGAFARMLPDREGIRRFSEEVIRPLKDKEAQLEPPFRLGFRAELPFYQLLDVQQRKHLRGIFRARLPERDIPVEEFGREERVELDVLAETYLGQARLFADLMEEYDYEVALQARRDATGRIIALSLSCSIFYLDVEDQNLEREFRYNNIYNNTSVGPVGRCRLKGHPRVGRRMRTDAFQSSPLLLLAVNEADAADGQDLDTLSGSISQQMLTGVCELSRQSRVQLAESEVKPEASEAQADEAGLSAPEGDSPDRLNRWETGIHPIINAEDEPEDELPNRSDNDSSTGDESAPG